MSHPEQFGVRPSPHGTHEVFNQSQPRVDLNEYEINVALREAVAEFAPGESEAKLIEIGAHVGGADYQHDAELANTLTPRHISHDRWGNRVDEVEFHPAYHNIMGKSVEWGLHTSMWADPKPGANVMRAAGFYLAAQIESGHSCPISMTHAVVPALRKSPDLYAQWEPRLLATEYDPELRDPATKPGVIFGMAMTEKQGGSDVRTNTTRAKDTGDGTWTLTGHKWFCSAPQSDAFLVLASDENDPSRTPSCFLVPRILPGGTRNAFFIQRLKDKLGNKSNASSEIELDGAIGWLVGEVGRGVKTIIEMVNRTRLDCVIGAAAGMRQGVAEAVWHAKHRSAFGKTLIDQPAMRNVIADLQLESEAATWTTMRLAAAHDAEEGPELDFRRLATAVSKYWVCKRGPHHAYESLECLGGNGYTEWFPLARRYREAPVLAVWEGSGNVIALDVLRALARHPQSGEAFLAELETARGRDNLYDAQLDRVKKTLHEISADPSSAGHRARMIVEDFALALQAQVLLEHAPGHVAEAFLTGRIDRDSRGIEYGTLTSEKHVSALLERA